MMRTHLWRQFGVGKIPQFGGGAGPYMGPPLELIQHLVNY